MASADFRVVIHAVAEGGYWGEVPALPGCVSEGDTREECRANVLDAARGCLECYVKRAMARLSSRRGVGRRSRAAPRQQDDAAGDFAFDIQVVRNNPAKAVKLNVF